MRHGSRRTIRRDGHSTGSRVGTTQDCQSTQHRSAEKRCRKRSRPAHDGNQPVPGEGRRARQRIVAPSMTPGAERQRVEGFGRLDEGLRQASDWYLWGPYLSERQWGTVREDYSADGDAWNYLPHDHARSRAYRWGEDGLAGFCDIEQRLCVALALWNGRDPILKERAFGLTGSRGQSRRGRQGVLVVSRRGAQPRLEQLALPLPAAGVPVSAAARRKPEARQARSRVRVARYRNLRRRPLLGRRRVTTPRPTRPTS